jgi:hypothetical protein
MGEVQIAVATTQGSHRLWPLDPWLLDTTTQSVIGTLDERALPSQDTPLSPHHHPHRYHMMHHHLRAENAADSATFN